MLAIIVSSLILSAYADGKKATGLHLARCNRLMHQNPTIQSHSRLCAIHLAATDMSVLQDVVACLILDSILRPWTCTSMHRSNQWVSCRCCLMTLSVIGCLCPRKMMKVLPDVCRSMWFCRSTWQRRNRVTHQKVTCGLDRWPCIQRWEKQLMK